MTTIRTLMLVCILSLLMVNCKQNVATNQTQENVESTTVILSAHVGEYVSESYFEREKGYDWVAVSVKESKEENLLITIHSRDDIKKPTCSFEAECKKKDDSTFVTTIEDKNILFTFTDTSIKVSAEKTEDSDFLRFFCNGGATIEGTYTKLDDK